MTRFLLLLSLLLALLVHGAPGPARVAALARGQEPPATLALAYDRCASYFAIMTTALDARGQHDLAEAAATLSDAAFDEARRLGFRVTSEAHETLGALRDEIAWDDRRAWELATRYDLDCVLLLGRLTAGQQY